MIAAVRIAAIRGASFLPDFAAAARANCVLAGLLAFVNCPTASTNALCQAPDRQDLSVREQIAMLALLRTLAYMSPMALMCGRLLVDIFAP
jgi:hypothetical protein